MIITFVDKDLKLLEEAYQSIIESSRALKPLHLPTYFGPEDQKCLELLYEQMTEDFTVLLKAEEEFIKKISKQITEDFVEVVTQRIRNNGKIDYEYMSEYVTPFVYQALRVFGADEDTIKDDYWGFVNNACNALIYTKTIRTSEKAKKESYFICFKSAEWIIDRYNSDVKCVLISDGQEIEKQVYKTIKDTILVRYKLCSIPITVATVYLKRNERWAEWRRKKLELESLYKEFPEMDGIFR